MTRSAAGADAGASLTATVAIPSARRGTGASPPVRPGGRSGRLTGGLLVALAAFVGLAIVATTDQVVPATSAHQAELRIWIAARAAGVVAYLLLAFQVTVGLVLSHPTNKATWKLSKRLFPWHEDVWVFVLAFIAAHVVSLVVDPYAGVGLAGAVIPGLSSYRSAPVALGTLALHALVVTGLTARYTRLLPPGAWLRLHRLSLVVFGLAWVHGVTAGTDSGALLPLFWATGLAVLAAAACRYWVLRPERRSARPAASPGANPMTTPQEATR